MNIIFQLAAAPRPYRGVHRGFLWRCVLSCLLLCAGLRLTRANPAPPVQTLSNGLRVLVRERHATPLVALDLWVRAGSREEMPEETGSAHFLEHTLFKGTAARRAGQADWDIENLGATLNAATGPDYAHYYTVAAASHALQALDILADVVRNAALPDAEVERERGVILDELAQHDSDPKATVVDRLYANAFAFQPYGHSPGGTQGAIRLRGRDTLAAFYRRTYQPARCILVVVGDITPDQARQWAEQAFGGWNNKAANRSNLPDAAESDRNDTRLAQRLNGAAAQDAQNPAFLPTPASVPVPILPSHAIYEMGAVSRPCVGLAFPAPQAGDAANTAAALLTAEILGDSRNGGRFAALMAGSDAESRFTPRRDVSLWLLLASTQSPADAAGKTSGGASGRGLPDSHAKMESGQEGQQGGEAFLRAAVDSLRRSPPTDLEVRKAQRRLLARWDAEQETNAGLAEALGYAETTGGETPEALRRRVIQITPDAVQRFLARYTFSQPGLVVHLLASPGALRESSTQTKPVARP